MLFQRVCIARTAESVEDEDDDDGGGRVVVHMLELATIDHCTKLEISTFTQYEDMKGDKNAEIGVVWWVRVTQGHRKRNHLIERI